MRMKSTFGKAVFTRSSDAELSQCLKPLGYPSIFRCLYATRLKPHASECHPSITHLVLPPRSDNCSGVKSFPRQRPHTENSHTSLRHAQPISMPYLPIVGPALRRPYSTTPSETPSQRAHPCTVPSTWPSGAPTLRPRVRFLGRGLLFGCVAYSFTR
jgi:hypothetical protein